MSKIVFDGNRRKLAEKSLFILFNFNFVTFLFFRKNFVFLQIGYKILGYELREQQVAFGIESLLGNAIFPLIKQLHCK